MKKFLFLAVWCACCLAPKNAQADMASLESEVKQLTETVRRLTATVEAQQREIASLKTSQASQPAGLSPAHVHEAEPEQAPARPYARGIWNPEIGVIADTTVKLDSPQEDAEGADRVSVRELELVLGSAVDPYSRLDATVSFSDFEEASLEEAYYTHFGLPLEFTGRLGRFKPHVGKAIATHRDVLDTVDEPLVIQRYFGLEGYNKSGVDFTRGFDFGWPPAHQISIGVLEGGNGEDGTLFGDTRRHPTVYSHLKNYVDLSDATGLELGISHLAGSRDDDSTFEVNVIGLDGTLIHRFGDRRHLKLQSEAFHVSRTESFVESTDEFGNLIYEDVDDNGGLWGSYALVDWRFDPKWATGVRFDHVQLVDAPAENPDRADVGYTGYLTFHQSEFARWRLQYTHLDLSDGSNDNQIWLQGTFAIGEHKHKIQ